MLAKKIDAKPQLSQKRDAVQPHFSLYLRTKKEFEYVFAKGRPAHGRYLSVRCAPGEKQRFGIVVSTKVSPLATKRNKLKRQIKEMIRLQQARLTGTGWCMILVKKEALGASYQELERDFLFACKKAGILR